MYALMLEKKKNEKKKVKKKEVTDHLFSVQS